MSTPPTTSRDADLAAALLAGAGGLLHRDDLTPSDPTRIGRYRVLRLLGRGAAGRVYLARDPRLGRELAIKLLERADAAGIERFRREAELLGALDHPGIVTVYDLGDHDGSPFYAMEYAEGSSLDHILRREPIARDDAVELMRRVALACHAAHELGIVHRDLKPHNILVTRTPRVRPMIADFGVARLTSSELTSTGQVVGTPSYMAPEQARGEPVDARTDVYALGVILYQLLTGRLPFVADGLAELVDQICRRRPPRPRSLTPDLPRALERIALQAIDRSPARRYQTALALAEDLRAWQQGRPISARRPRPPALLVALALASLLLVLVARAGLSQPPLPAPATTSATTKTTPPLPSPARPPAARLIDSLQALARWEQALYRRGEAPDATQLVALERALVDAADGSPDAERHRALAALGRCRLHLGWTDEAATALRAAAGIGGPQSVACRLSLVRLAWDDLMRALLLAPDLSDADLRGPLSALARELEHARALDLPPERERLTAALLAMCRDPEAESERTLAALDSLRARTRAELAEEAATLASDIRVVARDNAAAKAGYTWVLERRPHDADALRGLALAHLLDRQGMPSIERGLQLAQRAIDRRPRDPSSYFAFALLADRLMAADRVASASGQLPALRAILEVGARRLDTGCEALPRSTSLGLARAQTWLLLALARHEAGEDPAEALARATQTFEHEHRRAPRATALLGLGVAQLLTAARDNGAGPAMGRAARLLDAAVELSPGTPRIHAWRGYQRRLAGDHEAAIRSWRQVAALRPALLGAMSTRIEHERQLAARRSGN